jgi:hypothetical protein
MPSVVNGGVTVILVTVWAKYSGAANSSLYGPTSKPLMKYSPFPLVTTDQLRKDLSVLVFVAVTETFAVGKFVTESVTLPEIAPPSLILASVLGVSSPAFTVRSSASPNDGFSLKYWGMKPPPENSTL